MMNTTRFTYLQRKYDEYDKDYIFATVQTLNRDEHLYRYQPDEFSAIILDESHHSLAATYQKIMN